MEITAFLGHIRLNSVYGSFSRETEKTTMQVMVFSLIFIFGVCFLFFFYVSFNIIRKLNFLIYLVIYGAAFDFINIEEEKLIILTL